MIIVLKPDAPPELPDEIRAKIQALGLEPLHLPGTERVVMGALGDERALAKLHLESHPHVESVRPVLSPYTRVSREVHPEDSIVSLGGHPVGGSPFTVIAGPCAVESLEQMSEIAATVKRLGAHGLRGGAFKPRSSPYSFQGLGREGLEILARVSRETGLPVVTEVTDVNDVDAIVEHAACLQVGARNMQNFKLLEAVGRSQHPVLLKRGMSAKIDEFLLAAEYVVNAGNPNVILCERGIRTFENATRNTLDLNAVPVIKQRSHLPIIVDPSHGTGLRELVAPMARAAAAAGADGIIVEVHRDPAEALSDGRQSLYPEQFAQLMDELDRITRVMGRTLASAGAVAGVGR